MSSRKRNRSEEIAVKQPGLSLINAGLGLGLLSAAAMAFEVVLTHLFSEVFQYHFAFLAVSTSILGLGIGAAISFRLRAIDKADLRTWLSQWTACVALLLPLTIVLFIATGFVPGYIVQILLGTLPFVLVSLITTHIYKIFGGQAAWLYAFDLVGAALGLFGTLGLLNVLSAVSTGIALGLVAALAAVLFAGRNRQKLTLPLGAAALVAVFLLVNLLTHWVDLPRVTSKNVPADKTMYQVLANDSSSKIIDSAYSSYARVDLVSTRDSSQMYAFTNAGAGSYMLAFDGDLNKVSWLQNQVEYLPFIQFDSSKTLILGAGAGKDVLQALLAGSQNITAVEINPAMVALTRKHASYNGNILNVPGVDTVVADGRDFIAHSSDTYNMIYMNLVYSQAPAPGSNALSEAYVFTAEAFQSYWQHLSENGRLAVIAHQGLEGTRAMITAIQALDELGIPPAEALKHMALLMYNANDVNQSTSVFILSKQPLSDAEVNLLNTAGTSTGMSPLYLPKVYENLFKGLNSGEIGLKDFLVQTDYNLFATHDDQPFFFNLNPGLPEALKTLLIIAAAALLIYLLTLVNSSHRPPFASFLFFGGLGAGYFLFEMPLIQRTQLISGNPTLAMVLVLAALLLGGGLGSYLSSKWDLTGLWQKLAIIAALVTVLITTYAFIQPALIKALAPMSLALRLTLWSLSLLPAGVLMGMPFANGLRLFSNKNNEVLPYLWGWNSVTSVAGSAVAASVAMLAGFRINMFIAAGCYLVVALTAWMLSRKG
jgi:SAM-dependent methyltransferase